MKRSSDDGEAGGVYWMEASKRRLALRWLRRHDLTEEERGLLETFVVRYRTDPTLSGDQRRRLAAAFDRLERRLRPRPGVPPDGPRRADLAEGFGPESPIRTSPT